jgi:hypothetical protein
MQGTAAGTTLHGRPARNSKGGAAMGHPVLLELRLVRLAGGVPPSCRRAPYFRAFRRFLHSSGLCWKFLEVHELAMPMSYPYLMVTFRPSFP